MAPLFTTCVFDLVGHVIARVVAVRAVADGPGFPDFLPMRRIHPPHVNDVICHTIDVIIILI